MRYSLVLFSIFLLMLFGVISVRAEEAVQQDESRKEKVMGGGRDYTALTPQSEEIAEDQVVHQQAENRGFVRDPNKVCTAEDREKIKDYDAVMVAFYEDIETNGNQRVEPMTTREMEQLKKNMDVYQGFFKSDDFKEAAYLRQICNSPEPPRPLSVTDVLGLPNILDIAAGKQDGNVLDIR